MLAEFRRSAACIMSVWTGITREIRDEDFFLERQWYPCGAQERGVPTLPGQLSARYRVFARDQGRTRPVRERFARLLLVDGFRREEGLFGHRDLLETGTAVRDQRLSQGIRGALRLRRRIATRLPRGRQRPAGGVPKLLRGHRLS